MVIYSPSSRQYHLPRKDRNIFYKITPRTKPTIILSSYSSEQNSRVVALSMVRMKDGEDYYYYYFDFTTPLKKREKTRGKIIMIILIGVEGPD